MPRFATALATLFALLLSGQAWGQFTAGNLVVYRVGDGTTSLSSASSVVNLVEFGTGGVATGFTTNFGTGNLTASGTATSEGLLTLGNSGQSLVATGYRASVGVTSISGTTSAATNRTVALVNGQGNASYTFLSDAFSGNNIRSAATLNGTELYISGTGTSTTNGVRYTTVESTTSTRLSDTSTNLRAVQIVGSQLYVTSAAGGGIRLGQVGNGLPTTSGQTITNLNGLPTGTGSPYQFYFARVGNPTGFAGPNVLYFADDGVEGGSIVKFTTTNGTTWTASGSVAASTVRGLTGIVTADNTIELYGTTGGSTTTGGGLLYRFIDSGAQSGTISGSASTINTADQNFAYRGIAFSAARLEWSGGAGTWDLTATNFTNTAPTSAVPNQRFFNAYAANFGNITSDTAITVGTGINPQAVNVSNSGSTYTFTNGAGSNGIQGLGALNKSGAGTLVLASSNTYTGGTTISGGTLTVANTTGSSTGSGTVTVATSGTLNGTGIITGATTVQTGGTIRGDSGTGTNTLNLGNTTLIGGTGSTGATLATQLTTSSGNISGNSKLAVSANTFNLDVSGGRVNIALLNDAGLTNGGSYSVQLVTGAGGTNNFLRNGLAATGGNVYTTADVNLISGSNTWLFTPTSLSVDVNNNLVLAFTVAPVPEPATVLAIGAAGLGAASWLRRRRKATAVV